MIVILRDVNTLDPDVIFVTETTTAQEIKDIIDNNRVECGDTDNYDWESIEGKFPDDVKCYKEWNDDFQTIYW